MRLLRPFSIAILLACCLGASAAPAPDAADAASAAPVAVAAAPAAATASCGQVLTYVPELTLWFVLALFVVGVGVPIRKLSRDASWSLTDALSEKTAAPAAVAVVQAAVAVVPPAADAAAAPTGPGAGGTASASRLVAFLGTVAMLAMFMGFGLYAIWAAFNGKAAEARDTLKAMSSYLLYGSAMYAPYAFNQIKSAFSS